jgi:hypothetical protein
MTPKERRRDRPNYRNVYARRGDSGTPPPGPVPIGAEGEGGDCPNCRRERLTRYSDGRFRCVECGFLVPEEQEEQ